MGKDEHCSYYYYSILNENFRRKEKYSNFPEASCGRGNIHKRDNEVVVTMLKEPGGVDEKMIPKKVSMR